MKKHDYFRVKTEKGYKYYFCDYLNKIVKRICGGGSYKYSFCSLTAAKIKMGAEDFMTAESLRFKRWGKKQDKKSSR